MDVTSPAPPKRLQVEDYKGRTPPDLLSVHLRPSLAWVLDSARSQPGETPTQRVGWHWNDSAVECVLIFVSSAVGHVLCCSGNRQQDMSMGGVAQN